LLHLPEVLDAALKVDLAKISLGAWDQQSMEKLNRPEPGLTYEKLYSGIRAFSRQFEGTLWIEVFLVAGVNDSPEHIRGISSRVNPLKADMVHLNTVVRPPSEDWAEPVGQAQMDRLAGMFEPRAELISAPRVDTRGVERSAEDAGIVRMIERRPCTIRDIAAATGVHINEVSKYLSHLVKSGRVKSVERDSETYYVKE
jgi:wyosine [tRNA(Phe)-imidazoG37] synthetase (radical SAM superfamily)